MWYKNVGTRFFRFITNHAFDRRMDRQHSRVYTVRCNPCSRTAKIISEIINWSSHIFELCPTYIYGGSKVAATFRVLETPLVANNFVAKVFLLKHSFVITVILVNVLLAEEFWDLKWEFSVAMIAKVLPWVISISESFGTFMYRQLLTCSSDDNETHFDTLVELYSLVSLLQITGLILNCEIWNTCHCIFQKHLNCFMRVGDTEDKGEVEWRRHGQR